MMVHVWLGPLISLFLSLFGSLLGLAYVWGKVRHELEVHGDELRKLKSGLYNPDGTLIYMTKVDCMSTHNRWETSVSAQINEVKSMISDLRTEMLQNTDRHTKEIQKLMKFVGRVEEYMSINRED